MLTQGDKLNLIKARKFQQTLQEGRGENLESSSIHDMESSQNKTSKTKTTIIEGKLKLNSLNSLRTAKPSLLPKRDGSRSNSR